MAGDTSVDMMLNVLPGTMTGIFALNAGLSSINQVFQNMTKSVDNHFGILEASVVSATALLGQLSMGAASAFGEYEQGMKIVQAVSGQTSATVAELGNQINEFSVKYRMDIDQLTEGLQTLGRAGLKSASEQTEVLENGLQTAKLEGRDLNSILQEIIQNTTLLGGDLKSANFGEQTKYVNDLLVATSMTAPINTHDISETLKYSGGMLAAGGGTIADKSGAVDQEGRELIEDYMGTVAAFAQKGVTGSIAGTALRAFFNKPATQDSSVTEALSSIHLKPEYLWEEGEEQMKPVSEQIGIIQAQMDKLNVSQMDRLQIWSKIVGGKMGQQMIKLDSSDIKEVTKDIREANSAESLATQSMQTYQSAVKQTGEAGSKAFRAYGEHVARFGTIAAKILTPILDFMSNPVISTTAFSLFLMLIGRAFQAVKKIFAGLRGEIGMIKASMKSLVLNQPTRKALVGNNLWGGAGLMEQQQAYNQMSVKASEVQTKTQQASTTSTMASREVVSALAQIDGRIEYFRTIVTATNNKIKETLMEINSKISSGITNYSQQINKATTSAGAKIKTEFSNASTQGANSFSSKMGSSIKATSSRMRSEFQAALNSLTFSPKVNPTPLSRGANIAARRTDLDSSSYFFTRGIQKDLSAKEAEMQGKFNSLLYRRNNVAFTHQMENAKKTATNQQGKAQEQLNTLNSKKQNLEKAINAQTAIIDKANVKIDRAFNKYTRTIDKGAIEEAAVEKEQAIAEKSRLKDKMLLLDEEIGYKVEEVNLYKEMVTELSMTITKIKEERLSLLNGKGTTKPGAAGVVGNIKAPIVPNYMGSPYPGFSTNQFRDYGYSSGAHLGGVGVAPGMAGSFNWNNVPSEYRPNYVMTGGATNWKFDPTADRGQKLLAKLRSEEVAITREAAAELGITNKELVRFYEELLQVNAALAKTTTIQNGKTTTHNGMAAEQALMAKHDPTDTLTKTKGNMVPIYSTGPTGSPTAAQMRGLKSLFGTDQGVAAKEFEKDFKDSRRAIKNSLDTTARNVKELSRYSLPQGVYSSNQINTNLLGQSTSFGQAGGAVPQVSRDLINETVKMQEKTMKEHLRTLRTRGIKNTLSGAWNVSGASNISKGLTNSFKGLRGAVGKVTNFMGGPFFAGMMAIDIAMQVWNHLYQDFAKKIEEATNKLNDMVQKQEQAEQIFFQGQHEEGQPEIKGWEEDHPDATSEEKEDALLGAYSDIYDNRNKGLSALDANTQQLAIATEEVKRAADALGAEYLDNSMFAYDGLFAEGNRKQIATGNLQFGDTSFVYAFDKSGVDTKVKGQDYFENQNILLSDKQKEENYPWLKEFGPILAADIWTTGNTEKGLTGLLGNAGIYKLKDQLSSTTGFDQSAFTRHGYNIVNSFGSERDFNRLQMAFKNYKKDFSKLAKQTRRFEKATGATALGALNSKLGQGKNMKRALKDLSVQDPKLVNYIKSLAIKTGMSEQQVLMAAQLQQLQEMQEIANNQVTPRMESLVSTAYQSVAYGGQTLNQVQGSGGGAVSAAQNAAAIAALLNAQMESKLDEQSFKDYQSHFKDPNEAKYKTQEQFAGAVQWAMNHPDESPDWLLQYGEKKVKSYAATNAMMYNPNLSTEDANKMADAWYDSVRGAKGNALYDTLRKGAQGALANSILAGYDSQLDQDDGDGSGGGGGGGGSGSGNKDKGDSTGTKKERVDLVLCNKKEIPKLNVNLFKKPPSFTILNKNFKLRDVRINSEDKPKAIMAAIKNSFIDIQKRTDPKIIQDEEAVYDPNAATDGTNLPSGSTKTRTN